MSELTGENRSNGRFEPGRSGNPAGRPKGARGRATLVADALLEERVKAVVDNLIDRALAGSIPATRLCLDRTMVQPRDRIALASRALERGYPGDAQLACEYRAREKVGMAQIRRARTR